jgi:hypothetical protein
MTTLTRLVASAKSKSAKSYKDKKRKQAVSAEKLLNNMRQKIENSFEILLSCLPDQI